MIKIQSTRDVTALGEHSAAACSEEAISVATPASAQSLQRSPRHSKTAADSAAYVLVIQDQGCLSVVHLDQLYYSIGRGRTNRIRLKDTFVSREHALLVRVRDDQQHQIYVLFDGSPTDNKPSTNGTFVNGKILRTRHTLAPGDRIHFSPRVRAIFETLEEFELHHLPKLLAGAKASTQAHSIDAVDMPDQLTDLVHPELR